MSFFNMESRVPGTTKFISFVNGSENHFDLYRVVGNHIVETFTKETLNGSIPDGLMDILIARDMAGFCATVLQHKNNGFKVEYNTFNHQAKSITFWVEKDELFENDVTRETHKHGVPHFVGAGKQIRYRFIANWETLSPEDFKVLTNLIAAL